MADPLKVDRLPPHSLEAEQGVLGCVMLSPNDCLGECVQKFKTGPEVFYDLRHRVIYETMVEMYDRKAPVDPITLQQQLKDRQQLEAVGGLAFLSSLPDTVPSAANLGYYMEIVWDKYILRKMLQTCTDVVARVYEQEGEVDKLLDEVERDILRVSEARVENTSNSMKDLVRQAITTVEHYHERKGMLTGIGTGFGDLDKMTSGRSVKDLLKMLPGVGGMMRDSDMQIDEGEIGRMRAIVSSMTPREKTDPKMIVWSSYT